MSLNDPATRPWRRVGLWSGLRIVLLVALAVVAFATGWSNALVFTRGEWINYAGLASVLIGRGDVAPWVYDLSNVSIFLGMAVCVAAVIAGVRWRHLREDDDTNESWGFADAIGIALLFLGIGMLLGTAPAQRALIGPALITLAGVIVCALRPIGFLRRRRRASGDDWARRRGTRTAAVVTECGRANWNDVSYLKVTFRFTDVQGRDRWHGTRVPERDYWYPDSRHRPEAGDRYPLWFDPNHPGRRRTIFVDLTAPEQRLNSEGRPTNHRPMKPNPSARRRWTPAYHSAVPAPASSRSNPSQSRSVRCR